jgi:hypothetical protein
MPMSFAKTGLLPYNNGKNKTYPAAGSIEDMPLLVPAE